MFQWWRRALGWRKQRQKWEGSEGTARGPHSGEAWLQSRETDCRETGEDIVRPGGPQGVHNPRRKGSWKCGTETVGASRRRGTDSTRPRLGLVFWDQREAGADGDQLTGTVLRPLFSL